MIPQPFHLLPLFIFFLTAAGCASGESSQRPDVARMVALRGDPAVRGLMDKTLKNLRFIEGGSYLMGDFGHYTRGPDNKLLHKVDLDSFSMSAYKTSYEDYDIYTKAMGLAKIGQLPPTVWVRPPKAGAGVNWYQARGYCQWLGALLDLPMDLPTEAQWEYAARNRGQNVAFATDTGKIDVGRNVWEYEQRIAAVHALITDKGYDLPTLPLGQFPPTPLGLYDMMTDGYEWMLDWYGENYYAASPAHNPGGPATGTLKVLRGAPSSDGQALSHGDGTTVMRNERVPAQANVNPLAPELKMDASDDTTARCVVNLPRRVGNAPAGSGQ